jgi:glycerophosphoryl diester phosphodiesterase
MPVKAQVQHPFLHRTRDVLVMAHRGASGHAPQNTMPAFQRAVDAGVDVLETDIHSTADGVLVTVHDPTVDATTDGTGAVHSYTLAELQRLDAGYRWSDDGGRSFPFRGLGIAIPTLEEVATTYPQMRFNVDIKQKEPPIVDLFCQFLVKHRLTARVLVGSFHEETITAFRRRLLGVPTAASRRETAWFYGLQLLGLGRLYHGLGQAFQIPERYGRVQITPAFVRAAQDIDMEVHIWTVNETVDMERLLAWGVDGLITNYPERLLALLGEGDGSEGHNGG